MLKLNHLTGFGSGAAAAADTPTSYAFDGTGDYLEVPDHADWDIFGNTDNKTLECFIKLNAPNIDATFFHQWEDGNNNWVFAHSSTSGLWFGLKSGGNWEVQGWYGGIISDTDWHHVALVKVNTEYGTYLDGVQVFFVDDATTDTLAGVLTVGERGGNMTNGFIDEARIYDGNPFSGAPNVGLTDTITVPTTQHTSDANTLLLIHGGETYNDTYLFDGSDSLTTPDHANWDFGASDFTIEAWYYFTSLSGTEILASWYSGGTGFLFRVYATGQLEFYSGDGGIDPSGGAGDVGTNAWHHVAVSRNGSNVRVFVDGTQTAIDSSGGGNLGDAAQTLTLCGSFNGNMDEFRISDNARYTAAFTPSLDFSDDANTLLLIKSTESLDSGASGSGATFTDTSGVHTITETGNAIRSGARSFTDSGNTGHTVTENGNAQRETAQEFKFADDGVGYFFDGTGDYLSIPDHADFFFSTADFTIDFWFYPQTIDESIIWQQGYDQIKYGDATPTLKINLGGASVTSGTLLRPNIWYHVMVTRNSTTINVYLNGVNDGSVADGTQVNNSTIVAIGANTAGNLPFEGYIDEFRISTVERESSGFTPPTAQYTSDANTVLLIHGGETKSGTTGSGATFTDSGNTGHTVTEVGNAIESTGNLYKF